MHIKINIPPAREKHSLGYSFPELKKAKEVYTIPLEKIALKDYDYIYEDSEYENGHYVKSYKSIRRYWILSPEISADWKEIHDEEYKRISKVISKFTILEIDSHNKQAIQVFKERATESIIESANIGALFGIEIDDESEQSQN